ncbi:MAG: hypothetical protein KDC38_09955 [Planctomycetes bacterium]|nr:hypothetical protein [Planctomycetota bacterium]
MTRRSELRPKRSSAESRSAIWTYSLLCLLALAVIVFEFAGWGERRRSELLAEFPRVLERALEVAEKNFQRRTGQTNPTGRMVLAETQSWDDLEGGRHAHYSVERLVGTKPLVRQKIAKVEVVSRAGFVSAPTTVSISGHEGRTVWTELRSALQTEARLASDITVELVTPPQGPTRGRPRAASQP